MEGEVNQHVGRARVWERFVPRSRATPRHALMRLITSSSSVTSTGEPRGGRLLLPTGPVSFAVTTMSVRLWPHLAHRHRSLTSGTSPFPASMSACRSAAR